MKRAGWLVLVFACLACGCTREQVPACQLPAIDLFGWRAIVREGGASVPRFDVRALPYFRARGDVRSGEWSASLIGTSTIALELASTSTRATSFGEVTFMRVREPLPVPEGRWVLRLERERKECSQSWKISWGPAPEDLPELTAVAAMKARASFVELRGALAPKLESLDPWGRIWVAQEIARAYQAEGDPERSVEAWKKTAELAEMAGVPTQASWALRSAAFQCAWLRCAAQAAPLLDRAEALDREVGNQVGLARAAFYRGYLAQQLGEYRRARRWMEQARAGAHDLGLDADEASYTYHFAVLLAYEGRAKEGYALLAPLEPWYETRATKIDRSKFWSTLGWLALRADDAANAKLRLQKARVLIRDLKDPLREANAVVNLAQLEYLEGDLRRARALLAEIPGLGPAGAIYLHHPAAVLLEALVLLGEGKHAAAERVFEKLEVASREENGGRPSDYTWRARYGVGQAKRASGDVEGALRSFQQAIDVLEAVGRHTVLQESRAQFRADRRRVVEETIALLLERGNAKGAWLAADRALAELLGALETEVRIARLSATSREEWSKRLAEYLKARGDLEKSRKKENLLAGTARRNFRTERDAAAGALRKSFDALYAFLDEASPESAPQAASATDAASLLKPGEALLEYVKLQNDWHAFFVTAKTVKQAPVGAEKPFEPWAQDLQGMERLYVVDGGLTAARDLASHVLPSGKRVIEQSEVALLPHAGFLRSREKSHPDSAREVRSEAREPEASKTHVGTHERAGDAKLEPSSGEAVDPRANEARRALVIADPSENLPHARTEGTLVARALGDGSELLLGEAATREAVLTHLAGANLIHFAGHGILEAADPWAAHLELAQDETLGLEDILITEPQAEVVILSGCDTGRAQRLTPDASIGITEAFLVAGAGGVLATDRPIQDTEATRFITTFYEQGGQHHPRQAFRKAALRAIAENDTSWTAFRWFGGR